MQQRWLGFALAAFLGLCAASAQAQVPMRVEASARQPDGKILMAGQVPGSQFPMQIRVGRINADGTLDTAFAGGWVTYGSSTASSEFRVTAIAVGPDGRAVIAGIQDGSIALLRIDSSGSFDPYFGGTGTGLAIDHQSQGLHVNAISVGPMGDITGFGSYAGSATNNVTRAALVHYDSQGFLDPGFSTDPVGIRLPYFGGGTSELNAVAPWGQGVIGVGYEGSVGDRNFLVAAFTASGDLDPTFATGGYAFAAAGVAQAVWTQPGSLIVASGHNDDTTFGHASNASEVSILDGSGNPYTPFGFGGSLQTFVTMEPNGFHDGSAGTVAGFDAGNGDLVFAGSAVEAATGRSWFYNYSVPISGWSPSAMPGPNPRTDADDTMTGAFAGGDFFVAVGTRDSASGEHALRARYFTDTGDFDTDFPTEGEDSTPNALVLPDVVVDSPGAMSQATRIRITGINVPVAISIANGVYGVDCQGYTTAPGTVVDGQYVCVSGTGADTPDTKVVATLTAGDVSGSFNVTTSGLPDTFFSALAPNPASSASPSTFSFISQNAAGYAASGFECSLDGAPFAACSSPASYPGLSPGTHAFAVRGRNAWGVDPTPASYSWTVLDPADTTIASGPPTPTRQTTATFAFSSNDPAATFQCSLSGAAFAACTSPASYSGLSNGSYTFRVRASNALGTDPTPATYAWTVDTIAPVITFTSAPSGTVASANASFTFTVNESLASLQCAIDGGAYVACTSPVAYTGLPDGFHTFTVSAQDLAGNSGAGSRTWVSDATPPETTITSGPSGTVTTNSASFAASSNESATFQCRLDGGAWVTCGFSFTNLAEGSHTFDVRAVDSAGNVDPTPASRTWFIDSIAPGVTIDSGPPAYIASTSATIAFSSGDPTATFQCGLDYGGTQLSACTSPVTLANLSQSGHTFYVQARDPAGNTSPLASWTWYVDTVAPQTTITQASLPPTASVSISFYANDSPVTFECQLDAGSFAPCSSPAALDSLADGSHTFQVRATDAAGNVDPTPASIAWTTDTTPPDTVITAHPYAITQSSSATFSIASNEGVVSFKCRIDGGSWFACGSGVVLSNLAAGTHTFDAQGTDWAGNVDPTPASFTWTVDFSYGPDTAITSGPPARTASTSATITFNSPSGPPATGFVCAFGGAQMGCTSPWTISGLGDGDYSFSVYAVDGQGDVDTTPASLYWTVDTTAPDTSITTGPSGTVPSSSATFQFSSNDVTATFECKLDAAAFAACANPASYSALADGMHTFQVRARDAAGNVDASPASATWSVDTTAPNTTIASGPPASTSQTTATFTFSATEGGQFQCKLDGSPYGACSSPVTYASLAAATHSFAVYATDAAGNADASPATWSWTIDLTPPDTTITGGPSGNNNPNTASFTFISTESGSTFQCKLDSGAFAACTSPKAYSSLAKGSHTFQVKATDAAGNTDATPASRTWSVK